MLCRTDIRTYRIYVTIPRTSSSNRSYRPLNAVESTCPTGKALTERFKEDHHSCGHVDKDDELSASPPASRTRPTESLLCFSALRTVMIVSFPMKTGGLKGFRRKKSLESCMKHSRAPTTSNASSPERQVHSTYASQSQRC